MHTLTLMQSNGQNYKNKIQVIKTVLYLILFAGTDAALPPHWDDMKGDLLKLFPLTTGSQEYNDVETEVKKTGLAANIISVCSISDNHKWVLKQHKVCLCGHVVLGTGEMMKYNPGSSV